MFYFKKLMQLVRITANVTVVVLSGVSVITDKTKKG